VVYFQNGSVAAVAKTVQHLHPTPLQGSSKLVLDNRRVEKSRANLHALSRSPVPTFFLFATLFC
jgi:hypothetical protein